LAVRTADTLDVNDASPQVLSTMVRVCSAFFEPIDRQALILRIIQAMIELTHGDRGTIFLVEGSPQEMTSLVATGLEGQSIRVDIQQGIAGHVFRSGEPLLHNDVRSDARFYAKIDESTGYVTKQILSVPLRTLAGRTLGVIEILNSKREGGFRPEDLQVLQILSLFAAIALEHKLTVESLTETNESLKQSRLDWVENMSELRLSSTNRGLQEIFDRLPSYAESDSSILIEGESGTGKEYLAQLVHARSRRRDRPFVAVNCAAIPESLFEAELFGVAKGAATGTSARRGKVELAHGGTLFLDEIGELPLAAQAKLLRVLQERMITRVGSEERPRPVDFRIVAATNRDLAAMIAHKTFREDLYYRINVVRFHLPPLRERKGDVPELVRFVLDHFLVERGWRPKTLSPAALERLAQFEWPGNIRQLQNKLENAMILSGDRKELRPEDFQLDPSGVAPSAPTRALTLVPSSTSSDAPGENAVAEGGRVLDFNLRRAKELFEHRLIERALVETAGNKSEAARLLGITREGLRKALLRKVA
jgi:transcriptional regulator with GAF, ATPase, and Fis domain